MRDEEDYEPTLRMKAGHYENRKESVEIMIRSSTRSDRSSPETGSTFDMNPDGSLNYTREEHCTHSRPNMFNKDITGKRNHHGTAKAVELPNVTVMEIWL